MESIFRTAFIYLFLMLILRLSGRRTMGELGAFDFAILLIISEATQQAMVGDDRSVTNSVLVISTLFGMDQLMGYLKTKSRRLNKILESTPIVVMRNGKLIPENLKIAGIEETDILEAARSKHGLRALKEIDAVVLEKDGDLSILPKETFS